MPAYSDSRYAEYYQHFSSSSNGVNGGIPAASTSSVSVSPSIVAPAGLAHPAYAPPAYSPPTYSPPTVPPTNYRSTAYGPSAAASAAATAQSAPVPNSNITTAATGGPSSSQATAQFTATVPPLALDGYCPVTLVEQQRWQVGDRRWGVIHRGRTYLFTGPEQQKRFLADPDRYSPAISGQDVVMAIDYGQDVSGKRALGISYQNRIYLFSNEASRQIFSQNPKRYVAEVLQAESPNSTTTLR
ncbi:MAG TPA: hypothetical protein VFE46_07490 [Pirellulales bacterium]|nr:hypothetical protein [Pirellulales bacterium]